MPSLNPFTSVKGKNVFTLFDIRLDSDFLVFRGNEHESSGQLLKGVVAVCVPGPTRIEDIRLRLTGTRQLSWNDTRVTAAGIATQNKVDKTAIILEHKWEPFWGTPGKTAVLAKGNYEFPFELLLPGDTAESVEGLNAASITYKLKATMARGKLAYDLHTYKHVRVVRTLESSALEFLHAMSVENIWPNKVEYSIVVPRKAIVFGSSVPLETRFTPLLKGLEIGHVSVKLMEIHDVMVQGAAGAYSTREYRRERSVASWLLPVTREEHWQEMIEDTGQEGWVMKAALDLPRKLGRCLQDVNVHGIKVRHKLKMVVALKNPDGHISELRATLPITIFISPNIPLDEEGNLTLPAQVRASAETTNNGIAPPGYGEHVLDQLYDELEVAGLQTPAPPSGGASPVPNQFSSGSDDDLAQSGADLAVQPAALSSRLQSVALHSQRDSPVSSTSSLPPAGRSSESPTSTPPLSRHHSGSSNSVQSTPEHVDVREMLQLCKVPSYATAMKTTRVSALNLGGQGPQLPDYHAATSTPSTPTSDVSNPFLAMAAARETRGPAPRQLLLGRRQRSSSQALPLAIPHYLSHAVEMERRGLPQLVRVREGVA